MSTVIVFDGIGVIATGIWAAVAVSALVTWTVALHYAKRGKKR